MLKKIFKKIFRDRIKEWTPLVEKINQLEKKYQKLSIEQLKNNIEEIKNKIQKKEGTLDEFLPDVFAIVRETSKRTIGLRHFDVQLLGGIALHKGMIAEMKTGEGKTLTATLALVLNALEARGVHLVTVNDYLAKRDTVWMGPVYHSLGLTTACLVHENSFIYDPYFVEEKDKQISKQKGAFEIVEKFLRPVSRKEAYQADIVYGTNHEFGFDYLRDNLAMDKFEVVQRELNYAIIDEVDSILIDEARTPLIISGVSQESIDTYKLFDSIAKKLKPGEDFEIDEKKRTFVFTESGLDKIEKFLGFNPYYHQDLSAIHHLEIAIKAHYLYERDRDYVVKNNQVIIVDEFTGRLMFGRRWSGGLHQAIEVKEGVPVQPESKTIASISIQNFFKKYKKLAGMTGTAMTSAEEFWKVYGMEVVEIPTNKPFIRKDLPDKVFYNKEKKWQAVVEKVKELYRLSRPVLIGTTSIQDNEIISQKLKEAGIPHQVLNAKNHEKEALIIAQAGKLKAVTVATNMAGRGVDIILGGNPPDEKSAQKIKELGGLFVIGTERHESRRIDNQLRGRAGRQGDPGETQFFISLEDELPRVFGGEKIKALVDKFNLPKDQPIEHPAISKAIESAQAKVEGLNFDLRKHLLEYDQVINLQREKIYHERRKILFDQLDLKEQIFIWLQDLKNEQQDENQNLNFLQWLCNSQSDKPIEDFKNHLKKLEEELGSEEYEKLLKISVLRTYDLLWSEHLEYLQSLIESVSYRGYGQKDPLIEFKQEAIKAFENFEKTLKINILATLSRIKVLTQAPKVGRNDPCPCGSGKKYKKCGLLNTPEHQERMKKLKEQKISQD